MSLTKPRAAIAVTDLLHISLALTPTDVCVCGCQPPGPLPTADGAQERRWQRLQPRRLCEYKTRPPESLPNPTGSQTPHQQPALFLAITGVPDTSQVPTAQSGPHPCVHTWGWPLQLGTCLSLPDTHRWASAAVCLPRGRVRSPGKPRQPGLPAQVRPCLLSLVYTTSLRKSCPFE